MLGVVSDETKGTFECVISPTCLAAHAKSSKLP